jgi:hypothetical protein
MIGRKL